MSKILVVDDASFMRLMISQILSSRANVEVIEAENGEVALKLFLTHHPDLVFLDITMPVRDGLSTLSEILRFEPNAKVIMCSAVAQDSVVENALRMGAIDFIIKPFRRNQLLDIVNKYLVKV